MQKRRHKVSDWDRATILYRVHLAGRTMADISRAAGYARTAANVALLRQWPAVEAQIASAIGVLPQTIWPSRYDADGLPIKRVTRRESTAHRLRISGSRCRVKAA